METHTVKVTKDITRLWYMNDVVPAIIAQWPAGYGKDITINQDNAPPHPLVDDPELLEYLLPNWPSQRMAAGRSD